MQITTTIYGLVDPQTKELRYVGKTIQSPSARYSSHISPKRNKKTHCEAWIKGLITTGLKPELLVIDQIQSDNWQPWEQFYIEYFKSIGCRLTNHTKGGDSSNLGRRWRVRDKSNMKGAPRSVLLNNDREFESLKDCAYHLGGRSSALSRSIKLGRSYKNNIVKFKDEPTKDILLRKIDAPIIVIGSRQTRTFGNAKLAAKELSIDYSGIMKCLKGNIKSSRGYKFEYL